MAMALTVSSVTATTAVLAFSGYAGASVIQLQIATRPDFSFCVCPIVPLAAAANYTAPGLNQDTVHYIRARAVVGGVVGDWSPVRTARTPVAATLLLATLSLSDGNYAVGTPESGQILGATTGSTITGTNLPSGFTINSAARTWAWSGTGSAGTPTITLTEVLAGYTNSPNPTDIPLAITAAPVTLGALSFSDAAYVVGVPESGTILGATAGSGIAAAGLPTGVTINGAARTWAWDGTGSAGTPVATLTETLAGTTNTPRNSTINFTISAAPTSGDFILLENGDRLLQENGDKILLETSSGGGGAGNRILNEAGDFILTEAGDKILQET